MPALSDTMGAGRLIKWTKNSGEKIKKDDVIAEVETDKAVMELVARVAGTLLKQNVAAGATVAVAGTVGWLGSPGESVGDAAPTPAPAPAAAAPPPAAATSEPAGATVPAAPPAATRPPSQ